LWQTAKRGDGQKKRRKRPNEGEFVSNRGKCIGKCRENCANIIGGMPMPMRKNSLLKISILPRHIPGKWQSADGWQKKEEEEENAKKNG
jgi:hypothetical protein